jgi:hypothetical protein
VTPAIRAGCALLGWPYTEELAAYPFAPTAAGVERLGDGRYRVRVYLGCEDIDDAREYTVNRATLLLAMTLAARAVPALEVGPCPECEGSRWDDGQDYAPPGPCLACVVDGKPTGVHRAPAFEAVLMGAPRVAHEPQAPGRGYLDCVFCAGEDQSAVSADWRTIADDDGVRLHACDRHRAERWCGHEGARAALAQIARDMSALFGELPKHPNLAVWGDYLRHNGEDLDDFPWLAALAECPALPTWVLAWLAGECPTCDGEGDDPDPDGPLRTCKLCAGEGLAIGPHLPALEAGLLELWRRATVECGGLWGCDGTGKARDSLGRPVDHPRCAGLGRVRPEEQAA